MIRKLLPVLLALVGLGGGVGAGLFLRPAGDDPAADSPDAHAAEGEAADAGHGEDNPSGDPPAAEGHADEGHADEGHGDTEEHADGAPEYVKMNNQFVVPVVTDGRVRAMVVLSLSLEVGAGTTEAVYQREPKLRDAFLQVMFDHANVGGFSGSFTDGSNLILLRNSLKEAATLILGEVVSDVLITDIARQDS
jgi:flagellar protein FliL